MKYKHLYLITILTLMLCTNCAKTAEAKVSDANDYDVYLATTENLTVDRAKQDELFWSQKLEQAPNQFPYLGKLASTYTELFSATGDVAYLKKAEKKLLEVNEITTYGNPSYLRGLAYNYISQHQFKEALELLIKAELLGENLQMTQKMLFDVYLELGNYKQAQSYLKRFENLSDFDYLIRLSKWSDHKGNLDAAIKYMEKAMGIAESSNLKHLKQWSYTNIADFYGHAGEIDKSYRHFLKALELDPNNAYAKKGIAWIVYSHEKNPAEALRILNDVTQSYKAPDYYLLKAEIADYMGRGVMSEAELGLYKTAMKDEAYGDMYNKYNVLLHVDKKINLEQTIAIAQIEVDNRPTPQSYDLLAWAYFNNGNLGAALNIVEKHIIGETFEPETLYHVAEIYKAAGKQKELEPLKKELLASIFELGPTMTSKITKL
ncbi:tetratricopeptide repeat protein [Psychroserpens luteolus]|uniref:tetratricopeptide repeat protein n=1 Tax=Psychroserpens luteolus TaxID=2855840 RepID=UPI001E5E1FCD|nr:cell surface protein [Psychroserpens luteolus]MCD2259856.1 cell surface protein [Psychroserpens luteolus]